MEFPGQGSDLSSSSDLSFSSINAGSSAHYVGLGIEHVARALEMMLIPLLHSGNSRKD